MKQASDGWMVRVHITEADLWFGKPLHEAISRRLDEENLRKPRVFKGLDGAVLIELLSTSDRETRQVLKVLDEMVAKGAVTLQKVDMTVYGK